MKAEYVPPAALPEAALMGLLPSFAEEALLPFELWERIEDDQLKVFVIGDGNSRCYTAVSVLETRSGRELQVDGLWVENPGQGWRFRTWLEFCKRLGAAWDCDRVVTKVKDSRQLRGLVKNGCKVTAVEVALEIDYGRQENHDDNLQ